MKRVIVNRIFLALAGCLILAVLVCLAGLSSDFNYYVITLIYMFVSLCSLVGSTANLMSGERSDIKRVLYFLSATFCCIVMLFFLLYFPLIDSSYGFARILLGDSAVVGDKAISFASIIFATSALLVSGAQSRPQPDPKIEDANVCNTMPSGMKVDAYDDDCR